MTCTDNKRWILDNNVHSLPYSHYRLSNMYRPERWDISLFTLDSEQSSHGKDVGNLTPSTNDIRGSLAFMRTHGWETCWTRRLGWRVGTGVFCANKAATKICAFYAILTLLYYYRYNLWFGIILTEQINIFLHYSRESMHFLNKWT